MRIDEVFSGNFLKADDLQGKTVRVTISKVEIKEFDDGNKIVISFQGKDKTLVCNKTNSSIIAENLGSRETDDWVGQTILLTVKKVEFQGKLVPAIRVVLADNPAPVKPKATPARQPEPEHEPEPDSSDEVPF